MLNDYKGLKLIASSNPHIRTNEDTRSIMLDVIIALCPALIMSVIRFGFRALISVLVSVVSAMFFEWLYRKLMHKTQTLGDLSAAVTGVLLAFVCPVTLPYWMLIVGNFFAIFTSPIAMVFLIVAVGTILFSIYNQSKINKREAAHKAAMKAK